ncbi:hypothetical protein BpHYR1_044977 [Brachionus plicatilis]|uniref:Uncharacterized protein n=1 Tax=Brachionus plicatilis TaxID=10195 RepID=A0A3M7Q6U1_BRAPC|nr:hypothetical protein BpHYR1_044977 [Brachionus plicatilis]
MSIKLCNKFKKCQIDIGWSVKISLINEKRLFKKHYFSSIISSASQLSSSCKQCIKHFIREHHVTEKKYGTNIEDKSESMLKAARKTEKNLALGKRNYTKRFYNELRSSEIVELNEENKELYDHLKHATNTSPSVKSKIRSNKKRLKHLIRKAQLMSELKNTIKLDRMKHFDRNKFWSIISHFKNKKAKVNKIQSKDLTADKFKSFYAELLSHTDKPNTQEQENIKKEVNEYFNSIQNRKVDFIVTGDDVEKSIIEESQVGQTNCVMNFTYMKNFLIFIKWTIFLIQNLFNYLINEEKFLSVSLARFGLRMFTPMLKVLSTEVIQFSHGLSIADFS